MLLDNAEGTRTTAMLVHTAAGAATPCLPAPLEVGPLLVVGLDQGSIGAAGMAFASNALGMMIHVKFDKFHRLVRDVELSLKHAVGGVFLKCQLCSS